MRCLSYFCEKLFLHLIEQQLKHKVRFNSIALTGFIKIPYSSTRCRQIFYNSKSDISFSIISRYFILLFRGKEIVCCIGKFHSFCMLRKFSCLFTEPKYLRKRLRKRVQNKILDWIRITIHAKLGYKY